MKTEDKALSLALRLLDLQKEAEAIDVQIKELKNQLSLLYPGIEDGISPPFFTVSIAEKVEVIDMAKAAAFFMKNKPLQPFFKLTLNKDAFTKIGKPGWAILKPNSPAVRVNQKQVAAALDERRTFVSEAENPVNTLAA